ncbi:MAG: hypothetical protein KQI35_05180 [Bacteroidetes bacterium]|nr:hypothetical protein [Bacteroidota bacterium]
MKKTYIITSLLATLLAVSVLGQSIHHEVKASLNISGNTITVNDQVTIPARLIGDTKTISFSLNKNLDVDIPNGQFMLSEPRSAGENAIYKVYTISLVQPGPGDLVIPFEYSGVINDQIKEGAAEVARGFSETSGIISEDGVYLGGSTYWLPSFEEPLFTFNLEVTLQKEWNVVSQGKRTKNEELNDQRYVRYESPNPDEEAYLIAGPFTEYEQMAGDIAVQAFLRTPDEELANRYIGVTSQYLKMYEELVGPYPYTKFALVENFWETGFGMPSFTLLGQRVIRLPFILYTSYPHELLHNWWGNSVYVEMESGNWCEGITAYMADHMMKEQQGQGAEYRQTTLQKFTDYVNVSNDFPLVDFRSRNNSAEEAIGYGKCLMMNHMLRKEVGDELFIAAYQDFYKANKFTIASFDDIQRSFEKVTNLNLQPFFEQWTKREGAPNLVVSNVTSEKEGDIYKIRFTLEQTQDSPPFFINIPVAIFTESKAKTEVVTMELKKQDYVLTCQGKPVRIEVDPQFDVFRRLDKAEVPPALSQLFGSEDALIVLPFESPYLEDYSEMADKWQKSQEAQNMKLQIVLDKDLDKLPDDQSAWVLGFENKFADAFDVTDDYAAALGNEDIDQIESLKESGSLVFAIPNPSDNAFTTGFVATRVQQAIPGLTRLLPHYGKYSFLGFEGERPNNVLKGSFPALKSPLHRNITYDDRVITTTAKLEPEPPLITQQ